MRIDSCQWNLRRSKLEQRVLSNYHCCDQDRRYNEKGKASLNHRLDELAKARKFVPTRLQGEEMDSTFCGSDSVTLASAVFANTAILFENDDDRTAVYEFNTTYLENLSGTLKQNGRQGTLTKGQALRLIDRNQLKLALQEDAAAKTILGHHGIKHLVKHNARVAQRILEKLQSNGVDVKSSEFLLAQEAAVGHDIGYALLEDEITKDGIRGQEKVHPLLGARIARKEKQCSILANVLTETQWDAYHQTVLFHGAPAREHQEFFTGDQLCCEKRGHNLQIAFRTADTTHGMDETKLPPVILEHPQALGALRLMTTAQDLGRLDLVEEIREASVTNLRGRSDLSERKKSAFAVALGQMGPSTTRFLLGRFEGDGDPHISTDQKTGQFTIKVTKSALCDAVHKFFNSDRQGKQLASIRTEVGEHSSAKPVRFDVVNHPDLVL